MIRFNNDYNRGALESILNGLTETNTASYAGYGEDQWCGRAEAVIKKLIGRPFASVTACSLVFMPPFVRPIRRPGPPFLPAGWTPCGAL